MKKPINPDFSLEVLTPSIANGKKITLRHPGMPLGRDPGFHKQTPGPRTKSFRGDGFSNAKSGIKVVSLFLVVVLGLSATPQAPVLMAGPSQDGVTQTLISLLDLQDRTKISADDYASTSLGSIVTYGTPAGYRIKIRYLDFGIALVEALKISRDQDLRQRLTEMVQWSRDPRVKAEAILTLASLYNSADKKYLKEALLDSKVGIRFAAVEALQLWGQPEAIPLLRMSMGRDWSPFMQVFAAQALLSLGDETGLPVLWKNLNHDSWVVRAMAARYLGDYAKPEDYERLTQKLNTETNNDFVISELAIAALKLIALKGDKITYTTSQRGWKDNDAVRYKVGKDKVIDVEPLVISAPRRQIPASLQMAAQINSKLLKILKDRLNVPLDSLQAQDPILQELYSLVTPSGFALVTRYSQISYLMVEGLAGTNDLLIRYELETLAQRDSNPLVRATALVALSYNKDPKDAYMVQDALRDKNPLVRQGALEAAEIGHFDQLMPTIFAVANDDPSPALQAYGAQVLCKFGDAGGRNLLINYLSKLDWPARAMSFWYLGRYGQPDDYTIVLSRLSTEQNPFVQSEIALALLRLAPIEE